MTYTSSRGIGEYHTAEGHLLMLPKLWRGDGTRAGAIYLHGATKDETQMVDGSADSVRPVVAGLAAAGHPVLGVYAGGDLWGNATALARITEAIAFLQAADIGAKTGPVVLIGASMGGVAAQNYAKGHHSSVICMVGLIPVSDLNDIRSNNRGGLAGSIDAAYPATYVEATHGATSNPHTYAATGLAGVHYRAYYSTSDPIVIPSTVTETVSLIGPTAAAVPMSGGHDVTNLPADDVIDYVMSFL